MGPRLPIFAENCSSLNTSWRKLIDKGVRRIYPAHGKPFSIDRLINKGYDLS
jgi:glyoxylase-like metal-dependent hydrolase (beta-lactamase superfamily II)